MSFENLNLIAPIQRAITHEGYTHPTPIQAQTIPEILKGKDLIGCAQTGTGKTAAFAIPILQLLHGNGQPERGRRQIKSLIVTPTRELALQIGDSLRAYGKHTGLRHVVIFGGVSQNPQTEALRRGIDIMVATPGRLLDLMNQGYISLRHLEIFVLDEADRMLDMGFINDVRRILAALPPKKQSLLFSATMPPAIVRLAGNFLHNPVKVEVTPNATTAETVSQSVYFVDRANKRNLLIHLLKNSDISSALVFTRTKYGADKVTQLLNRSGIKAEAIHGNKAQNARQRALSNFKNRRTRVLVATDIAARGIDVDDLSHVINFEIPNIPETYVHRIGRTGRAGASGIALSFCDTEEQAFLRDIYKLIENTIPVVEDHPYRMLNGTPTITLPEKPKKLEDRQQNGSSSGNRNRSWRGRRSPRNTR